MLSQETRIGKVRSISGTRAIVAIDPALVDLQPVIHGQTHHITQVGSLLKVYVGMTAVIGLVASASATAIQELQEKDVTDRFAWAIAPGEKSLILNLFGEISSGRFERGVTFFPDVDSEVHVVGSQDLLRIFSTPDVESFLRFGELSGGIRLPALLDLKKLISRHSAIVGSTGSGKSNAVSVLLNGIVQAEYPGAKVIIIDIHGEYSAQFADSSRVFSVGGANPLYLPFWLVPFDELVAFFFGRVITQEDLGIRVFRQEIVNAKLAWAQANGLERFTGSIGADSPIPFDLRRIWYDLYQREHATYTDTARANIAWRERGDAATMRPPIFENPGLGAAAPFKRMGSDGTASLLERVRSRVADRVYSFLLGTPTEPLTNINLEDLVRPWLEGPPITILDLSGVPTDVIDLSVGTTMRLLFDLWQWGRDCSGVGRQRPILVIFEEAHLYLGGSSNAFQSGTALRAVARLLREGRKYGLGAMIVSQRPSDIHGSILSQIGTMISLRLNNQADIGVVKSTMTDNALSVLEVIPSLRTGEALVAGEAASFPIRARFDRLENRPLSSDAPIVAAWEQEPDTAGVGQAIFNWRVQSRDERREDAE